MGFLPTDRQRQNSLKVKFSPLPSLLYVDQSHFPRTDPAPLARLFAMFGPRKGPPNPVPPKRRGGEPPRKAKFNRAEEEALKQQKYLDQLGDLIC